MLTWDGCGGPFAKGDLVIGQSHCDAVSTVADGAPVANDDAYSTPAGTPLTVAAAGVLGNDTDPNGDPLTATIAQPVFTPGPDPTPRDDTYIFPSHPAHGTVTINADGSFTYTPASGFVSTDSFKYTARDPRGANAAATVTIAVGAHAVSDYDGDGKTDIAVWRPSTGTWFVRNSSTGASTVTVWSVANDIPIGLPWAIRKVYFS